MPEPVKTTLKKEDYLTATEFIKKYGTDKGLTNTAFDVLFKKNKIARDDRGRLQQVVFRNKLAHSTRSLLKAHPLFHDIILAEIEKQKHFQAKQTQGTEK